jgi:hypothetical protein
MVKRIVAAMLVAMGIGSSGYAQLASTTSLVGNITDSANADIGGAAISATNEATRETYTGTTSTSGYYEMKFVKAGTYTVAVQQAGFQTMEKTGVIVQANQIVRTDFVMQLGHVSQTMSVMAAMQFRGEFFNVFNHPSFSNPGATLITTSSGTISASTFGNITSTSNNARQIQLGARLTF